MFFEQTEGNHFCKCEKTQRTQASCGVIPLPLRAPQPSIQPAIKISGVAPDFGEKKRRCLGYKWSWLGWGMAWTDARLALCVPPCHPPSQGTFFSSPPRATPGSLYGWLDGWRVRQGYARTRLHQDSSFCFVFVWFCTNIGVSLTAEGTAEKTNASDAAMARRITSFGWPSEEGTGWDIVSVTPPCGEGHV